MTVKRSAIASALAIAMVAACSSAAFGADIDTPYPGTITLSVDLTQAPRKIFTVN